MLPAIRRSARIVFIASGDPRDRGRARLASALAMVMLNGFGLCHVPAQASQVSFTVSEANGRPIPEAVVGLLPVAATAPRLARPVQVELDQVDAQFRPHVLAVQVGTQVNFRNSDNIRHEVYSFSPAKQFATHLYSGKTAAPVVFDKPGVVILGCMIHDSMRAYIYVLDTPYFATSDGAGRAIVRAPRGRYRLAIYHPRLLQGHTPAMSTYEVVDSDQASHQRLELDAVEVPLPARTTAASK